MIRKETKSSKDIYFFYGVVGFFIIWFIIGVAAFFNSLFCFGSDSSLVENILGLVLALVVGPFYYIYYFVSPTYCKKKSRANNRRNNNTRNNNRSVKNNRSIRNNSFMKKK